MKKIVVVTGGGTGGHLKVADCLIDEFNKRNIEVVFIGSLNGQDKAWFENDKRLKETIFLDTKGVVNKNLFGKIKSLVNIFSKSFYCLKIYKKYKIDIVVSVGGFSAASATFASIFKPKCKLFIHEQNSRMGKLNEITSKFAKEVFSSFDKNSIIKDYPVSKEFFENSRLRTEVKIVGFFGGSQGAVAINNFALKLAPKLNKMGIKIIHQTGKNNYDEVKKAYEKMGIQADVFAFSREIVKKMQETDFAVSRAGASTLWELCANTLPTFFIPYKFAAKNHQYYNAKMLEDKNLCFLQKEEDLSEEFFFKAISSDIKNMSKSLAKIIRPDASSLIIEAVLKKE